MYKTVPKSGIKIGWKRYEKKGSIFFNADDLISKINNQCKSITEID